MTSNVQENCLLTEVAGLVGTSESMVGRASQGPSLRTLGLSQVWQAAQSKGYEILNVVGVGSYGTVVEARKDGVDQPYAIKHIQINPTDAYSLVKVLRELQIMSHLQGTRSSPYFTKLENVFSTTCKLHKT